MWNLTCLYDNLNWISGYAYRKIAFSFSSKIRSQRLHSRTTNQTSYWNICSKCFNKRWPTILSRAICFTTNKHDRILLSKGLSFQYYGSDVGYSTEIYCNFSQILQTLILKQLLVKLSFQSQILVLCSLIVASITGHLWFIGPAWPQNILCFVDLILLKALFRRPAVHLS